LSELLKLAIENKDEYLKEKYYNEMLEVTKKQEEKKDKAYAYYISNHVENEIGAMHDLKQTKIFYMILSITMVAIAIISNIVYKKIKYRTTHDALTDTFNRYMLDKRYKSMLRKNKDFAAIMIDIDNFKNINDTYGHGFGDIVLINMCKVVKVILDKNGDAYRYGGEEFAVLLEYDTRADVLFTAEKIRYYVESMVWDNDIKLTVSIGVAFSTIEKEFTIQRADKNLYKAKHTGKNKVVM
jgi:diguanylate cyclase (GGDEF)-like protein